MRTNLIRITAKDCVAVYRICCGCNGSGVSRHRSVTGRCCEGQLKDLVRRDPNGAAAHGSVRSQEPLVRPMNRVPKTEKIGLCPTALNNDAHAVIFVQPRFVVNFDFPFAQLVIELHRYDSFLKTQRFHITSSEPCFAENNFQQAANKVSIAGQELSAKVIGSWIRIARPETRPRDVQTFLPETKDSTQKRLWLHWTESMLRCDVLESCFQAS